jgi:hypothetical protein
MAKYEVVVHEVQRYTIVVEADDEYKARDQVSVIETDDMDRDNEFYEATIVDVRKVSDG